MKKLQEEKEKLKKMTKAEAIDYIWTYYKLGILAVAFALIFLISLISSITNNKRMHPVIRIAVLNDLELSHPETITGVLEEAFPDTGKYTEPLVLSVSSAGNENDPYSTLQLTTYLAAGELDCMICDEPTLEYIKQTEVPIKVLDISSTVLGDAVKDYGITPLYYLYFTEYQNAENCAHLGEILTK